MPEDWAGLLEKIELAVAASSPVAPEELVTSVAGIVREARVRLSYPEEVAVVALVGGTGSGKSSLLNALVGADVAPTGGTRPTTHSPVAVVPASAGEALDGHLERLGIQEIHHIGPHDRLCLVDMPDTDSVEVGHRLQVERLIPVVDAVVWVLDPEKYRDATLHHEHVAPLSRHASRFVFVLNQADRLDEPTRRSLEEDLRRALSEDGIEDPAITATSAAPPAGPPTGIEELVGLLTDRAGSRRALGAKLLSDLTAGVDRLLAATGGSGLDFEKRAAVAIEEAMRALGEQDETEAMLRLASLLSSVAAEAGEVVGARIETLAVDLPLHVRRVAEGGGPPLSESVIGPLRPLLAERARANALLADAALALQSLAAAAPR